MIDEPLLGYCIFFDFFRAFGFIQGDDGKEYYCHKRAIIGEGQWMTKQLKSGQRVKFIVGTRKGREREEVLKVWTSNQNQNPNFESCVRE